MDISRSLSFKKEKSNKLAVPTTFEKEQSIGYLYLDLDNIIYLESDSNYTNIYTNEKKITASKTLGYFEKELTDKSFFRIHASYIINLQKLVRYKKGIEQPTVILVNGAEISVSRSKKKIFENLKTNRLPIIFKDEYVYIDLDSVLYIESVGNFENEDEYCRTNVYLTDAAPLVSTKGISFFETLLIDEPFFRIRNNCMVNLTKVIKYYKGRDTYITLDTGMSLTVSESKKSEFLQLFK